MTDELLNYGVAPRALIPESIHDTDQNTNNRVAQSQDLNRERDQGMRWLKSGKSGAKINRRARGRLQPFQFWETSDQRVHYRKLQERALRPGSEVVTWEHV